MQFPHWWKVSDYLKTHWAEETQNAAKVPYVWVQDQEGVTYYEVTDEDPAVSDTWHKGMIMIEAIHRVSDMFRFHSVKAAVEAEPHRALVVDIGGERVNALVSMMKECGGSYDAKMTWQDIAEVLGGNDPVRVDRVENMPHNFYNIQSVFD